MINNETIRNCQKPFPAIQGMTNDRLLGKILIKNIYQSWRGENIQQIRDRHEQNPYTLRVGRPSTDEQLKNDAMYFILHYLSYNPYTKDVELREIIPYRNTERIYIGQAIDEKYYKDSKLIVDGTIAVDDVYLKNYESLKDKPIAQVIISMMNKIENLQLEIAELKRQSKNKDIYTQGTL